MSFDPAGQGWQPISSGPYMDYVGPVWRQGQGENLRFGITTAVRHGNHRAMVHGGVVMSLAEYGLSMLAAELAGHARIGSVQIDVQFLAPGPLEAFLTVEGQLLRRTSTLFFLRADIRSGDKLVAAANGICNARPATSPAREG